MTKTSSGKHVRPCSYAMIWELFISAFRYQQTAKQNHIFLQTGVFFGQEERFFYFWVHLLGYPLNTYGSPPWKSSVLTKIHIPWTIAFSILTIMKLSHNICFVRLFLSEELEKWGGRFLQTKCILMHLKIFTYPWEAISFRFSVSVVRKLQLFMCKSIPTCCGVFLSIRCKWLF